MAPMNIVLTAVLAAAPPAQPAPPRAPQLHVYLPRTVAVSGEDLALGEVAVVLCDSSDLEGRARKLSLGRAPWPKERLTIDRKTILSRLAAEGIGGKGVRIAGAPKATVTRRETVVDAETILARAEAFLADRDANSDGTVLEAVRPPDEVVLAGTEAPSFRCRLDDAPPAGHVRVAVTLHRGKRQMALREVLFRRRYRVPRAVAARDIEPGQALTPSNVRVRTEMASRPAGKAFQPPFGRIAARKIKAGETVRDGHTASAVTAAAVSVRRRQMVRMRVRGAGFVVTCVGQALEDGRAGELIKVRNVDSQRVVTARVAMDGSVEPVFRR